MKLSNWGWRSVALLLIFSVLLFITPFLIDLGTIRGSLVINETDGFTIILLRTLNYGVLSAVVLVGFGFAGAYWLRRIDLFSKAGQNLGLLILPVTLGNICIAFGCKQLIGDSALFSFIVDSAVWVKLLFLILIQLWQFGLLYIYLFWMNFSNIPAKKKEYALACQFSRSQSLREIYLPGAKDLSILLACLGFVFALYEESKLHYLFKASPGTNSELLASWLTRNYQILLPADLTLARRSAFEAGGLSFFFAITVLAFIFLATSSVFNKIKHLRAGYSKPEIAGKNGANVRSLILIGTILVPICLMIARSSWSLHTDLKVLLFPFCMTFIAAAVSTAVAVLFGLAGRLGWQKRLYAFNHRSLIFFVILFAILLVPPLMIMLCGFQWMTALGYGSELIIDLIWVIGHVILTLPVLGSFVLFIHFSVSNNELAYLRVSGCSNKEICRYSFFQRFKANYLLLFLVCFSIIWNEGNLNSLFSDYIPSFVTRLQMLITGRAADLAQASGYLVISLLIGLLSVLTWRKITMRIQQLRSYHEKN